MFFAEDDDNIPLESESSLFNKNAGTIINQDT